MSPRDEEIAEISARANAATPGPWLHTGGRQWKPYERADVCYARTMEDAKFIAAAREDIPRLLREVKLLDKQLAAVREALTPDPEDPNAFVEDRSLMRDAFKRAQHLLGIPRAPMEDEK